MSYGYVSACNQRYQEADDLYGYANWALSGIPDMVKGAFKPEKPLSFDHFMDSFGVATLLSSAVSRISKGRSTNKNSTISTSKKTTSTQKEFADLMSPEDAKIYNKFLTKNAPMQVAPGIKDMTGFHVNGLGRVEPWHAYYNEYGYIIARTDYNAGNISAGIPDIHYHTYEYINGNICETGSHIPGEYIP